MCESESTIFKDCVFNVLFLNRVLGGFCLFPPFDIVESAPCSGILTKPDSKYSTLSFLISMFLLSLQWRW